MISWQEIQTLLRRTLRWWWVILLSVGVATGSAYYLSKDETRYYVAHTSLRIGNTLDSPIPDPNELGVGSALAHYYGELARREPILEPVQQSLKLPFTWQLLADRMLTTNVVGNANLLEISITDTDPNRAAAIAGAIGEHLISFSPTSPEKIAAEQQVIEQQIADSSRKIKEFQDKITQLDTQEQAATSASDLSEIRQKRTLINASLEQEQATYKGLLNYKSTSIVNSVSFFERAAPPNEPLPSKRKQIVAVAALAGLMLALAAIWVLEQVDNRVGGPKMVTERLQIEHLGAIPLGPPLLMASESFAQERLSATRDAQTNILLAAAEIQPRILMVTSSEPNEARSAFSLDLADLFGRSGHRVLLVDADFTSALLTRLLAEAGATQSWTVISGSDQTNLWTHLRPTPLANVALLPGPEDTGASAAIPSLRWRELVDSLSNAADVIIFDGPSTLSGPDAALLAPHVDGVVMTMNPALENRADVEKSKGRLLRQQGTRLLGSVMFTPARGEVGFGQVMRRLRGERQLALPAAPVPVEPERPVIITPLVHDVPVEPEDDSEHSGVINELHAEQGGNESSRPRRRRRTRASERPRHITEEVGNAKEA